MDMNYSWGNPLLGFISFSNHGHKTFRLLVGFKDEPLGVLCEKQPRMIHV